jgi:hypothetical protein
VSIIVRITWRWFSGAPLDGKWKTDAGWLRRGTRSTRKNGPPPVRWHYLSRLQRSAIRQALLVGLPAVTWATLVHPRATIAGAAGLVVLMAVVLILWTRGFRHRRDVVRPLHDSLAPLVKVPETTAPRDWLDVPVRITEERPAVITLPTTFAPTEENRAMVAELATAKLGHVADELDTSWRTKGVPVLTLRRAPQPPDLVRFADMIPAMDACAPGEIVLGLDRRRAVYRGSFLTDDPHWGCSVGSRRGKSTFLTVTAAQIIRQGGRVVGIDVKRVSFASIIGVPGFSVANDPGRIDLMWDAIAQVRAEMDERSTALQADPTLVFMFLVLMLDEINQFAAQSAAYWEQVKPKGASKIPPVWDDIAAIMWQGAQMRCHVIGVGQRLDQAATGGKGLRDSFGLRGLAGFRANQWKFLIGTTPIPRSSRKRGRWIWSDGEDETWVQMIFGTGEEVAAYASVGRGGDGAVGLSQVEPFTEVSDQSGQEGGTRFVVGLDAGAAELGVSVETFRKRRTRRGPIPGEYRQGNQPAWPADELAAWAAGDREETSA